MKAPHSNSRNDCATPDTTVWNTAAAWGTDPMQKSKDFCYLYCYTLFQIILKTMDKGCRAPSTTSPLCRTVTQNTPQVSKCLSFGGVSCSPGWTCQHHTVCRWLCGDDGAEPLAWHNVQLLLQGAIATIDHGAGLGQSNQIKISL